MCAWCMCWGILGAFGGVLECVGVCSGFGVCCSAWSVHVVYVLGYVRVCVVVR